MASYKILFDGILPPKLFDNIAKMCFGFAKCHPNGDIQKKLRDMTLELDVI